MTPIIFEDCFGWVHHAAGRQGVVLCGPHGHDEESVHPLWRKLAAQLAKAGLPTLRFDYHGTGDSAGSDTDPGRLADWLASIRAAVQCLRQQTGVDDVALVGLRLGALLAAQAAQDIEEVSALVLLAPPVSGGAYVRQLRAMSLMSRPPADAPPVRPERENDLEVGGFVLTAETIASLEQLDLLRLTKPPARQVLLFHRSNTAEDLQIGVTLRGLGCEVQEEQLDGYRAMIRYAPHLSEAPRKAFSLLTHWLSAGVERRAAIWQPPPPSSPLRLELPDASETPVSFGADCRLFGVYCAPPTLGTVERRPALLFLNTGANRHIGANRLTVTLARHLASCGFHSFRIDIAGIGDSDTRAGYSENLMDSMSSCADVEAALDWLESKGHERCVVIGLCSGAHLGFISALLDPRICELVLINPQKFTLDEEPPLASQARQMRPAVRRSAMSWGRRLCRAPRLRSILPYTAWAGLRLTLARLNAIGARLLGKASGATKVAQLFRHMEKRGVATLLIFTRGDLGLATLETHAGTQDLTEMDFPHVELVIIDGSDHTLTKRWAREHLAQLLERRLLAGGATAQPPLASMMIGSPTPHIPLSGNP